ncbi:MAG: FMN-binding protein [Ruminococcaceae bacterium]|nr:FMN-binding protein [Oscillospiraceae bacterium]
MKGQIKSIVTLVCICTVVAVLLAVTNMITAPIIEANQNAAANEALLEVMPEGKNFQKVDVSGYTLPSTVSEVYKEQGGGYVIRLTTTGYASGMTLMVGVRADGTVSGAVCLSSGETLGHEKTFGQNFVGKDAAGVDAVDTVSGATLTTGAYRAAVKDALNTATILGGGSVDLRTEEEILADNLDAALPSADGEFTKLFIVEVIEGIDAIDAIYTANNETGAVCVVGEQFIGVGANGAVISECDEATKANVESVMAVVRATVVEDVDISAFEGIHQNVISVKKTQSGNYIIDIKAAGYGINGGDKYHAATGEYTYIRVSVTAGGKIIDCLTLAHGETENIGGVCAKEEFYGQFDGKTEADYENVDAISGATITTDGYKTAIGRVFETVKILEGGAENEE